MRSTPTATPVLLVGSAICDVQGETEKPSIRMDVANQASVIGKVTRTTGGVCLNIARALRALGHGEVHLVSAVGEDGAGRELVESCSMAGIRADGVMKIKDGRTATVLCLLNGKGDVVFSLADVSILEKHVTTTMVLACMARCEYSGGFVVTDGDLPSDVLQAVCRRARGEKCTVVFDPATAKKAPRCLDALPDIDYVAPNVEELLEIANAIGIKEDQDSQWMIQLTAPCSHHVPEVFLRSLPAVAAVLGRGVRHVILTAGEHGAGIYCYCGTDIELSYCPALPASGIASVNGAGDCLVGGFVHGLSLGRRKEEALALGVACAREALYTKANVPQRFESARLDASAISLGRQSVVCKCCRRQR